MDRIYALILILSLFAPALPASARNRNKSGVAPQVLTLPKGGGTVKGLGETFVPDLNSGTGSYRVPLMLPEGRNGFGPSLALSYSSGRGNGPFGLGWEIGIPRIARRTEKGVPRYDDDEDIFTYGGIELVRIAPGEYRVRHEGFFGKTYHRKRGDEDFWEIWTREGERLFFGDRPKSRIEKDGQIFAWCLTKREDPNGNQIIYTYTDDGGTNLYPSRIEYAIYAVEFSYERRPDVYTGYRNGFGIETSLRCKEIIVGLNIPEENRFDRIRRYELRYSQSPDSQISLLTRIIQYGTDDSVYLPPLDLTYSRFDPNGSYRRMKTAAGTPPAPLADPNYELVDVNADGLADVLYTDETTHLYWLNLGDNTWASAQAMRRAPQGVQLSDDGVLIADMDGDGKCDLLLSRGSSFGYWRSYGDEGWEEFVRFRRLPNFSFKNPNVRLMDVNGDGLTDVVHTTGRYYTYWLNLEGRDWSRPVSRRYDSIFKEGDGPGTFFSADPNSDARLADMNGDGLQDLVSIHNGLVRYWPCLLYTSPSPRD